MILKIYLYLKKALSQQYGGPLQVQITRYETVTEREIEEECDKAGYKRSVSKFSVTISDNSIPEKLVYPLESRLLLTLVTDIINRMKYRGLT